MTAHRKTGLFWLTTAGVTASALSGGCTRISSAWSALTAPAYTTPPPLTYNPDPIAQGEDIPAIANATAPVAVESPESYAAVPSPEPVKIPVVNMFGELDGQGTKPRTDAADFGFQ